MLTFAYDPRKAATNFRKHAVSFAEAETVFDDRSRPLFWMINTPMKKNVSSQSADLSGAVCSSSFTLNATPLCA